MITAQCRGQVLEAKTASFKDDNDNDIAYGKIQLLVPDASGAFYTIQNIKVRTEDFGLLPDIAAQKNKVVTLQLETSEFKGKTNYYLAAPLNAKAA